MLKSSEEKFSNATVTLNPLSGVSNIKWMLLFVLYLNPKD